MKRPLTILLTLALCLMLLTPAVHADVIWEPMNNSFYEDHREECEYVDKGYLAYEGTVGYEAPGDAEPIWVCEAVQKELYISHVYTFQDGAQWGAADIRIGEQWVSCWIDLSTMTPIYDTRDFIADHSAAIAPYADELGDLFGQGDIVLWNYPGNSVYYTTPFDEFFYHDYATQVFIDENGDSWVYFPYIDGMEGWVYAPDPFRTESIAFSTSMPESTAFSTSMPASTAALSPEKTLEPTQTVQETKAPSLDAPSLPLRLVFVVLAVALLVIGSAILIFVLYGKKKK